ncbi:hypothetical protein Tco_0544081 [Tanacetum coccineum]
MFLNVFYTWYLVSKFKHEEKSKDYGASHVNSDNVNMAAKQLDVFVPYWPRFILSRIYGSGTHVQEPQCLGVIQDSSLWTRVIKAIHDVDGKADVIKRTQSSKSITVGTKLGDLNVTDSFRRTPRGGAEQQQLDEMVTLVNSFSLTPMADRMCRDLETSGEFSVASVRKMNECVGIWKLRANSLWHLFGK